MQNSSLFIFFFWVNNVNDVKRLLRQKKNIRNQNIFIDRFFFQQLRSQQDKLPGCETRPFGQITRKNESVIATSESISLWPQQHPLSSLSFLYFTFALISGYSSPSLPPPFLLLPLLLGLFRLSVHLFLCFALSWSFLFIFPPFKSLPASLSSFLLPFFHNHSYLFNSFLFIHILLFPSPLSPISFHTFLSFFHFFLIRNLPSSYPPSSLPPNAFIINVFFPLKDHKHRSSRDC